MSACQAALAPEAGVIQPKNKIDDNLLNILVNDPAGASVIGLPVPSAPEDVAGEKNDDALAQQAEILSGFPRRYATVEEVDDAIGKNRSRAYFAKSAMSGDWRSVCNVALAGMLLELVFTLLVKRLNIIAFVTRGLIGDMPFAHAYRFCFTEKR
ncbi:hypothetical protein, conserved [Eimeria praecox]|uniref:Uncharacterized protein n=1 Tax=Eimeria praecox TaxID=51316 RepID=U6GXW4_9EIME|nr:hypothetical protein, conserved [Eimeria praecox]